jgi:hypothetical protein
MSTCHSCDEERPFLAGQEGKQHIPLYSGGEHGGAMCYASSIYGWQAKEDKDRIDAPPAPE